MSDAPPPPPPSSFGQPVPSSGPDIGAALSYGWNRFTENIGPLILAVLLPAVGLYACIFLGVLVFRNFFMILIFEIIGFLLYTALLVGIYRMVLAVTRGEKADLSKAYSDVNWGAWLGFAIVYGLIIGVAFALCIIPGLFALAFWGLAPFYYLDQGKGLGDALKASADVAKNGYALPIFLAFLVGWAGGLVCGIGALVTYPIAFGALAFLYRHANGQEVVQ